MSTKVINVVEGLPTNAGEKVQSSAVSVPKGPAWKKLLKGLLGWKVAVIALSLPETIILRNVLKPRLMAAFIGVAGLGILAVGYLFNFLL